jgi:beta-phosphoglucomutase-like phosphatase (HAD superfamily)
MVSYSGVSVPVLEKEWEMKTQQIKIGRRVFSGIIFDVDGTIANTEFLKIQALCYEITVRELGIPLDQLDIFPGCSEDEWKVYGPKVLGNKWKEIKDSRDSGVINNLKIKKAEWCTGARELLTWLSEVDFPRARYTSAMKDPMGLLVENALGLERLIPVSLFGDAVPKGKGKPDPWGYVTLAKKLKIKPQDMIVVEDSKSGILAGKNAGAFVVKVPSIVPVSKEDAPFDLKVSSLMELLNILKR